MWGFLFIFFFACFVGNSRNNSCVKDSSLLKQDFFLKFCEMSLVWQVVLLTLSQLMKLVIVCIFFSNFFVRCYLWVWCSFDCDASSCRISHNDFRFVFTNWYATFALKVKSFRFVNLAVFSKLPTGFEMLLIPSIRLKQYLLQIASNSTSYSFEHLNYIKIHKLLLWSQSRTLNTAIS